MENDCISFSLNSRNISKINNCISLSVSSLKSENSLAINNNITFDYNEKNIMKRRVGLEDANPDVMLMAHTLTNKLFFKEIKSTFKGKQPKKMCIDDMLQYNINKSNSNISKNESMNKSIEEYSEEASFPSEEEIKNSLIKSINANNEVKNIETLTNRSIKSDIKDLFGIKKKTDIIKNVDLKEIEDDGNQKNTNSYFNDVDYNVKKESNKNSNLISIEKEPSNKNIHILHHVKDSQNKISENDSSFESIRTNSKEIDNKEDKENKSEMVNKIDIVDKIVEEDVKSNKDNKINVVVKEVNKVKEDDKEAKEAKEVKDYNEDNKYKDYKNVNEDKEEIDDKKDVNSLKSKLIESNDDLINKINNNYKNEIKEENKTIIESFSDPDKKSENKQYLKEQIINVDIDNIKHDFDKLDIYNDLHISENILKDKSNEKITYSIKSEKENKSIDNIIKIEENNINEVNKDKISIKDDSNNSKIQYINDENANRILNEEEKHQIFNDKKSFKNMCDEKITKNDLEVHNNNINDLIKSINSNNNCNLSEGDKNINIENLDKDNKNEAIYKTSLSESKKEIINGENMIIDSITKKSSILNENENNNVDLKLINQNNNNDLKISIKNVENNNKINIMDGNDIISRKSNINSLKDSKFNSSNINEKDIIAHKIKISSKKSNAISDIINVDTQSAQITLIDNFEKGLNKIKNYSHKLSKENFKDILILFKSKFNKAKFDLDNHEIRDKNVITTDEKEGELNLNKDFYSKKLSIIGENENKQIENKDENCSEKYNDIIINNNSNNIEEKVLIMNNSKKNSNISIKENSKLNESINASQKNEKLKNEISESNEEIKIREHSNKNQQSKTSNIDMGKIQDDNTNSNKMDSIFENHNNEEDKEKLKFNKIKINTDLEKKVEINYKDNSHQNKEYNDINNSEKNISNYELNDTKNIKNKDSRVNEYQNLHDDENTSLKNRNKSNENFENEMHLNTDLNNELEEANKNNGNFNLFETKEKEITIMEDNDLSKNSLIYSELNNDKYNAKNKDINLNEDCNKKEQSLNHSVVNVDRKNTVEKKLNVDNDLKSIDRININKDNDPYKNSVTFNSEKSKSNIIIEKSILNDNKVKDTNEENYLINENKSINNEKLYNKSIEFKEDLKDANESIKNDPKKQDTSHNNELNINKNNVKIISKEDHLFIVNLFKTLKNKNKNSSFLALKTFSRTFKRNNIIKKFIIFKNNKKHMILETYFNKLLKYEEKKKSLHILGVIFAKFANNSNNNFINDVKDIATKSSKLIKMKKLMNLFDKKNSKIFFKNFKERFYELKKEYMLKKLVNDFNTKNKIFILSKFCKRWSIIVKKIIHKEQVLKKISDKNSTNITNNDKNKMISPNKLEINKLKQKNNSFKQIDKSEYIINNQVPKQKIVINSKKSSEEIAAKIDKKETKVKNSNSNTKNKPELEIALIKNNNINNKKIILDNEKNKIEENNSPKKLIKFKEINIDENASNSNNSDKKFNRLKLSKQSMKNIQMLGKLNEKSNFLNLRNDMFKQDMNILLKSINEERILSEHNEKTRASTKIGFSKLRTLDSKSTNKIKDEISNKLSQFKDYRKMLSTKHTDNQKTTFLSPMCKTKYETEKNKFYSSNSIEFNSPSADFDDPMNPYSSYWGQKILGKSYNMKLKLDKKSFPVNIKISKLK